MIDSVTRARSYTDDVEWSGEDASRTEPDFLCRCVESAIKAGATHGQHPGHGGLRLPRGVRRPDPRCSGTACPNIDKAVISVHCHNDLGPRGRQLAGGGRGRGAADRMHDQRHRRAGRQLLAGGGRDGDADARRPPALRNRVDTEDITQASRLVSAITGFQVQPNKAIVGANAFAHESGIHQDGMLKHAGTYEIMTAGGSSASSARPSSWASIPAATPSRRSWRSWASSSATTRSTTPSAASRTSPTRRRRSSTRTSWRWSTTASRPRPSASASSRCTSSRRLARPARRPSSSSRSTARRGAPSARATARSTPPSTPSSAIFPHAARLQLFQVDAVTAGTDAQAEVTVRLEEDGKTVNGQARRYRHACRLGARLLSALNKLLTKREKTAPAALSA